MSVVADISDKIFHKMESPIKKEKKKKSKGGDKSICDQVRQFSRYLGNQASCLALQMKLSHHLY